MGGGGQAGQELGLFQRHTNSLMLANSLGPTKRQYKNDVCYLFFNGLLKKKSVLVPFGAHVFLIWGGGVV